MTDYQRGRRKVKRLIIRAIEERNTQGYRENLGYDQQPYLQGYLDSLDLTYSQKANLISEFFEACDRI